MIQPTPKAELESRIRKLQAHLAADDLDGALILQNTDLFYFSGTIQQSHLYIPVEGQPLLMTRKSLARAREESALDNVVPLPSPRQLPALWREHGYTRPRRLGMELDVLPTNLFFACQDILGDTEVADSSHQIRLVRAVKSPYEVGHPAVGGSAGRCSHPQHDRFPAERDQRGGTGGPVGGGGPAPGISRYRQDAPLEQ